MLLLANADLAVAASAGDVSGRTAGQRLARGDLPAWRVVDSGEALLDNRRRSGVRSALLVPLRWRDHVFGVLELVARQPQAFDVPALNLVRKVAGQLAGWIYVLARRS